MPCWRTTPRSPRPSKASPAADTSRPGSTEVSRRRYGLTVHWLWILPLVATLGAGAAVVRILRAVDREATQLVASARAFTPVGRALRSAADELRATGTTMAQAARRYTPRHG